ncbi:MAG: hypothetical protein K2Z25_20375 [Beijerinckiaceae bacterium]|nr:hypothetical protein [Beijerinckiaceae bacterium]
MMTAGDVWPWIGTVVAGVALVAAVAITWLALLRWLIVIVPAIVLVGFAFLPELQLRFTAVLIGLLAILYVPLLAAAWVWRQVTGLRPVSFARAGPPSALELAHQMFADEEARDRADRQGKAVTEMHDQDDRDSRARDLERQGMVSLWSRQ